MNILAVDLCLPSGSVAVIGNNGVLSSSMWNQPRKHEVLVFPEIQRCLETSEIKLKPDIDLVVVTNGPGSFTGVRLSVSIAKGFRESGLNVCSVTTLEALTFPFLNLNRPVMALIFGRRKKFYCYIRDRKKIYLSPSDLEVEQVMDNVKSIQPIVVATGSGLENLSGIDFIKFNYPLAVSAGLYAARYGCHESLKPLYIRNHDAKRGKNV